MSSFSSPTGLNSGTKSGDHLLAPLAPQPPRHVPIAGVEVPAHADRPAVVEARVAAGPGPAHEEPALAVAQDEVRDHLLVAGVLLGVAPSKEAAFLRDHREGPA